MLVIINNFLSKEDIENFLNKNYDIENIINKVGVIISNTTSLDVYIKWSEFLTMKPGAFNEKHIDIHDLDEQLIAAILYLNDDFTGGEFIFENIKVNPKPGTLVFFYSNINTPHSVEKVIDGNRMSISMFFDTSKNEKYKNVFKIIMGKYKRDKRPI